MDIVLKFIFSKWFAFKASIFVIVLYIVLFLFYFSEQYKHAFSLIKYKKKIWLSNSKGYILSQNYIAKCEFKRRILSLIIILIYDGHLA